MDNQGKTDKQIRDSEVAAGIAIAIVFWIIGYLIIFSQKKQFQKSSITQTQQLIRIYIMADEHTGLKEIIKIMKTDVKINGDQTLTTNKFLNLLELALENANPQDNE